MNNPTLSTSRAAIIDSFSVTEADLTFKIKTSKLATGISQEVFFTVRQIDSSNLYRGKIRLTPSGTVTVQASKVVAGVETFLGSQTTVVGLSYSADTYLDVHGQVTGTSPTTINMKVWADGSAEPGAWTYTTTDSQAGLQTSGSVGLRTNLPSATSNAPVLFTFDDFSVTTTDVLSTPTPSPTAVPQTGSVFVADNFTRSKTATWGTADTGGDYTISSGTSTDFNVNGTEGTMNLPSAGKVREIMLKSTSQQDIDVQFKVKISQIPIGNTIEVFWIGRQINTDNMYRGKIRLTSSNTVTLQGEKLVGGVETFLGAQASTGITLSADSYIWVRSQVTGTSPTTINMKVWASGDTEPVSWNYTATDSEATLQTVGSFGLRTLMNSTVTNPPILVTFDSLNATTADATVNTVSAPAQTGTAIATDTFTRTSSSGWGSADTGGAYSVITGASANFTTDGSTGSMTTSTAASRTVVLHDTKQQDIDTKFQVKIDKTPTGAAAEAFWVARYIDPNDMYRGKIRFTTSNTISVQAFSLIGGTETALGTLTSTGITFSAGNYVWVRAQILGTNPTQINIKVWDPATSEPITWQYTYTDYNDSVFQAGGSVGLRTNFSASVTNQPYVFTFDNLNITTDDLDIFDPSLTSSGTATITNPSTLTVTLDPNSILTTSKLKVGVTHTQDSLNSSGDQTAISNARSLLTSLAIYQNQHIIGFGANNLWDDPSNTDTTTWNWSALDGRMQNIRDTGSIPIITLCCAPTWMVDSLWTPGLYNGSNTDWGQINKAPLDAYEQNFTDMIVDIVNRYNGSTVGSDNKVFPKVEYFQVWNEFKGLWNTSTNSWNTTKYNRMYGSIYDAIKAIRPEAKIGGPYVRFSKYLYPSSIKRSTVTDASYGTVDKRDLNAVDDWLNWLVANKNTDGSYKADFIAIDSNITTKDITDGTFPSDIFAATKLYTDLNNWLNSEMQAVLGTTLPIWWSEDYVGKVNGDPVLITPESLQPAALATMLYRHATSGTSVSLRWGPEEQVSSIGTLQGNKQNLYSSTTVSGGGQPYTNYTVYSYFRNYFADGTELYNSTFSQAADHFFVLSSDEKTLLINDASNSMTVTVTANGLSSTNVLGADTVLLIDTPSASVSSATPTPTPTPTPNPGAAAVPATTEETPQPENSSEPSSISEALSQLLNGTPLSTVISTFLAPALKEIAPLVHTIITPIILIGLIPLADAAIVLVSLTSANLSWGLILSLLRSLGLLPKTKPQGIVYDTSTLAPVAFATLSIYDQSGSIVDTVVTDVHGVYGGMKLPAGSYRILTKHYEYNFPTTKPRPTILQSQDFYKGEVFSVSSQTKSLFFTIPVDAIVKVLKKTRTKAITASVRFLSIISRVSSILFYPLTVLSIILFFTNPSIINGIFLGIYIIIGIKRLATHISFPSFTGIVKDKYGKPVPDAIVRLIEPGSGETVEISRSNKDGNYKFFPKKGKYRISIQKLGHISLDEGLTLKEIEIK